MNNATTRTPKQEAHRLLDTLPEDATWEQLAYTIEMRADIEAGLADVAAGRVTPHAEVRREFGLPDE
ncbi:MAG: hypothetical protein ACREP0_05170 [Rhodanobacteraceae bacterium]